MTTEEFEKYLIETMEHLVKNTIDTTINSTTFQPIINFNFTFSPTIELLKDAKSAFGKERLNAILGEIFARKMKEYQCD